MTRGQLKTRVARILGIALGTSDDAVAEVALLDELANEAVLDILARTRIHVRKAAIELEAGVTEFEIDDIILRFYGLARGDASLYELPAGTLDSSQYRFVGYNRIVLGLAGTGVGDDLIAYYTPRPTAMTLDSHDPALETYGNIPAEFHRAILNYMLWHAADKAGDAQTGRGERYRTLYEGQDAMAGPGSDLGRIKQATNRRATGTRFRRHREQLASDRDADYWVGG